ncbi:hypothetical protein [Sphingomonas sp.]|uniref:hypothetical protein n=1 Tax=Sphingomonas sp. TaxID=28214 RepID=UPI003F6F4A3F
MSTRYGYETSATGKPVIKLDFWLTVGRGQGTDRPSVRVSAGYPKLARNERAINLKVELPIALFEAPSLSASITVEHPDQAVTIDTTALAEAVRGAIGMDIDITIQTPEAHHG